MPITNNKQDYLDALIRVSQGNYRADDYRLLQSLIDGYDSLREEYTRLKRKALGLERTVKNQERQLYHLRNSRF